MDKLPPITSKWMRPSNVPFPNVWTYFEVEKDGKILNIKIQDVPQDRHAEVIDFMTCYYLKEEPLSKSTNILEDELSLMIYQHLWSEMLKRNMSLIAVIDDGDKYPIVGAQIISISTDDDEDHPEVSGEAINKMKLMYKTLHSNLNKFECFNVKQILLEWGLCVHPDNRKWGIGFQILSTLPKLAKAVNVHAAMIIFTSIKSQRLANKLGYKEYNQFIYKEFKDENGQAIFTVDDTIACKLMGTKFE